MISDTLDLPELLIKKGLPFAIYSFPRKNNFQLVIQKDTVLKEINIEDINTASGFVIADFESANTGIARVVRSDFFISENAIPDKLIDFIHTIEDKENLCIRDNISISKDEYLNRVEYLIECLKSGKLEKVVYSRVINKQLEEDLDLNKFLRSLRIKYKDAFVNMFHIPDVGTWVGASPESFFRLINNNYYSESLAGTKVITDKVEEPKWNNKEIIEQQLVSNFIESVFSQLGINKYKKTGPITAIAGNLYHIQTTFKLEQKLVIGLEGKIIAGLHPTPAVCGLPKGDAYNLIQKAEQHERRFYSGFIGPWKLDGQSQLFVNLRCAEIGKSSINIYVGGGLTEDSNLDDEYMETIHKSQTLLSVVENL